MKIRLKIFFTIFILVLITGMAATMVNQRFLEDTVEKDICNHLMTAAESREKHIETFLNGEKKAIKQLSESIVIERLLLADRDDPDYSGKCDDVTKRLEHTAEVREYDHGIFVLDKNGTIIASSDESDIGKDKSNDPYFLGRKHGVFVKDAYFSQDRKIDSIAFSAPVLDGTTFLGVVVMRVSMEELNKITTDRTGLGETGEIFLLNKDGYMITPSRFLDDTFLKQKVEAFYSVSEPEKYVAGYKHEVLLCKSYTGAEVLRVHAHIPDMSWTLVTEISKEEAFAPVARIGDIMLLILVGLLLLGIPSAILISGTITEPIVRLHHGTEEIIAGNLDYRVGTRAKDEIGQLSRAFDEMTASTKESRKELEEYSRGLEGMVEERTAELGKKIAEAEQQRLATLNLVLDLGEANKRMELEIEERTAELERFNKLAVGRELKMIELKKEINATLEELGREPRYKLVGES
jgi:methyl-accepting chemotaxis protein